MLMKFKLNGIPSETKFFYVFFFGNNFSMLPPKAVLNSYHGWLHEFASLKNFDD